MIRTRLLPTIIAIIGLAGLNWACNRSFLDRFPQDQLTEQSFFENEDELKTYSNSFYTIVPSWSEIWDVRSDDEAYSSVSDLIKGTRTVPASGGGWSWSDLRNINFFLENIDRFKGADEVRREYEGLARFFRAWFYFKMVKRFGDVPWYSEVISPDDEELLDRGRDSREVIMDSVLNDINFAIEHLSSIKDIASITKWTALSLKSRVFLFEGTYDKYHEIGSNSEKWLKECISASNELIEGGAYDIYMGEGDPDQTYLNLFASADAISEEIILAQLYSSDIPRYHAVNFRTNSSSYRRGVTKDLVDSYLMRDGSRYTDIAGYETLGFYEETTNRDPRLAQSIITPGYIPINENSPIVPDFSVTVTGFSPIKMLQSADHFSSTNDNDLPVFRFAEILLNFAEAKAELGELTQTDLDLSIGKIRNRVNMPSLVLDDANLNPDPYLEEEYPNVTGSNKGVILEIRRERRIELYREGQRWDDLMRWMVGENVAKTFYGIYFSGSGEYDLDNDGAIDLVMYEGSEPNHTISGAQYFSVDFFNLENGNEGRIMANGGNDVLGKVFESPKDYLYPIPLQELQLNVNLEQNPGWPKK